MCVYWYLIFVEFLNFVYLCKVQRNRESLPNLLVSPGSGICAKELAQRNFAQRNFAQRNVRKFAGLFVILCYSF
jgi:hypothetical protein